MSSPLTLLALEPARELRLSRSSESAPPSRPLRIVNTSLGNVAFKVRTTAPKAYTVRPSAAVLRPQETCDVQINFHAQGSDAQTSGHRFLVQAVAVQSADPVGKEWWAVIAKESIQEGRLSVVWEDHDSEQSRKRRHVEIAAKPFEEISEDPSRRVLSALSEALPLSTPMMHERHVPASAGNASGFQASTGAGQHLGGDAAADIQVKYDELLQYTLNMEKDKTALEAEVTSLQNKLACVSRNAGYSKLHVMIIAAVAVIASYVAIASDLQLL